MSAQADDGSRQRMARLEAWERLERPLGNVVPLVMLGIAALLGLILAPSPRSGLITLGVAGLTAAWILGGFSLRPGARERPGWMLAFISVLVGLMAVLVIRAPIYGVFTFVTYTYTFYLPHGPRRFAAIAAIAVVTATSQDGGPPRGTTAGIALYTGLIVINVVFATGINWFAALSTERNDLRAQALADLSVANRKLEASLADNARLHEQLISQARDAGMQDERQRMAREIHDTLAQSLAGIITQLQAADQATRTAEQRRHRDAALGLAREGLSEARRSVHALRPEPLQAGRIEDALTGVTQRWSVLHGVAASVTVTGPARPIPAETELVLLRTAQEALANAARHAGASTVRLTLSYIGGQVTLDVRDDGAGFQPGAPGSGPGGFGLIAMRERVEGRRGTLAIESEPGAGTTISASLPLAPPEPARPGAATLPPVTVAPAARAQVTAGSGGPR
jgi:signal transduction histidine kinase